MHHFFVNPEAVTSQTITITGPDVNHIKNVLRIKSGEEVLLSDGQGQDFCCEIESLTELLREQSFAVNFICFRVFQSRIKWSLLFRRQ